MLTPNSIPDEARPGRPRGDRRQPRAPAADHALPSSSIAASSPSSLTTRPAHALVGDQQVRARADHVQHRSPTPSPSSAARSAVPRRPPARRTRRCRPYGPSSAARADSRAAPPRAVASAGARSARHQPARELIDVARAHHDADIALAEHPREHRCGLLEARQPVDRPPGRGIGGRLGDQSDRSPRESPRRARAPGRRRARRSRRPAPARARTRAPAARCASRDAAGRRRPAAGARASVPPRSVAATSVGWWA